MTNNGVNGREILTADQVHDSAGVPDSSPHDPYLSSDAVGREKEQFELTLPACGLCADQKNWANYRGPLDIGSELGVMCGAGGARTRDQRIMSPRL